LIHGLFIRVLITLQVFRDFSCYFSLMISKYTRINSRFNSTEEWTSILENQVVEITQAEQKTEKKIINLG